MMPETPQQIGDEAIAWAIRLRHASAEDWEAFTRWLEADPAHLEAYEEAAAADEGAADLPPKAEPPRVVEMEYPAERRGPGRRMVLAWAAAAAIVGVVGYSSLDRASETYALETAPGERRSVALADGSRIHLNGASRILLDRENPRFASLERGEALFNIVHDDDAHFRVEAGTAVIEDLGTVFNVTRDNGDVAVEVAEGAVSFRAEGEEVNLSAGMTARSEGGRVLSARRDAETIGVWQRGLLSYSSAPLGDIARDLSRNAGIDVSVSPGLEGRRFSGVIMLDPDKDKLRRRVSGLLMVDVKPAGEGWVLAPSDQ